MIEKFADGAPRWMQTLPAGALTASVLFDVLALLAERPDQAQGYRRGAADLLGLGLSGSVAALGLELVDYLRAPADQTSPGKTRLFALKGAAIAVYLLDLAERLRSAERSADQPAGAGGLPTGLSLVGLALLAAADKLS